jgi:hypothetical protein
MFVCLIASDKGGLRLERSPGPGGSILSMSSDINIVTRSRYLPGTHMGLRVDKTVDI